MRFHAATFWRLARRSAALLTAVLVGCAPTLTPEEALRAQNREGLYSNSLRYYGHKRSYHRFGQQRIAIFPWQTPERRFKVPDGEIEVSGHLQELTEQPDNVAAGLKVRIDGPPYRVFPSGYTKKLLTTGQNQ